MGGSVICTGMDVAAALRLADPGEVLDAERVSLCLREIEAGRLEGQAKLSETDSP